MVKLRVDMRVHTEKFQFFNVKYHAIIEIVECESGRVEKKWLSASRLCEYAGTCPFPTFRPPCPLELEIYLVNFFENSQKNFFY